MWQINFESKGLSCLNSFYLFPLKFGEFLILLSTYVPYLTEWILYLSERYFYERHSCTDFAWTSNLKIVEKPLYNFVYFFYKSLMLLWCILYRVTLSNIWHDDHDFLVNLILNSLSWIWLGFYCALYHWAFILDNNIQTATQWMS